MQEVYWSEGHRQSLSSGSGFPSPHLGALGARSGNLLPIAVPSESVSAAVVGLTHELASVEMIC